MAEAKARENVAKADAKLKSMMASFFGNKYEDAEELYKQAANQFKAAKNWKEAGETFEKAAGCHLKLKSPHEVATAYQEAAVCYRKTDTAAAVRCYQQTSEVSAQPKSSLLARHERARCSASPLLAATSARRVLCC